MNLDQFSENYYLQLLINIFICNYCGKCVKVDPIGRWIDSNGQLDGCKWVLNDLGFMALLEKRQNPKICFF